MLTLLSIVSFIALVSADCDDFKLDCMMTDHEGSLWVTSVMETCMIDSPLPYSGVFDCYHFPSSNSHNGTFIADGCDLRFDCVMPPVQKNAQMSQFPLVITVTGIAVLLAMY